MTIFQVTGGGKVYGYAVSPDTMATVDSEGKVKVVAGPGTVTVTAGMSSSMHNNDTAKVKSDFPISLTFKKHLYLYSGSPGCSQPPRAARVRS